MGERAGTVVVSDKQIIFTCPDCGEEHEISVIFEEKYNTIQIVLKQGDNETGTLRLDLPEIKKDGIVTESFTV